MATSLGWWASGALLAAGVGLVAPARVFAESRVDVGIDPAPLTEGPPVPAVSRPHVPSERSGKVLDLCLLKVASDGSSYVRQRAVVFGPAGFEKMDRDPKFAELGISDRAREAFVSGLPLDRLYQVVMTVPPDPNWLLRESIPVGELVRYLAATTDSPGAGTDLKGQERRFAAYSVGCADWVFVPVIDDIVWDWQWFDPPTKKLSLLLHGPARSPDPTNPLSRGTAMLLPNIEMAGRVGAYHREGDNFVRVAVVNGATEGDKGMPDYPPHVWGEGIPEFLSAIPDSTCTFGASVEGKAGFRCGPGTFDARYLSKGTSEFNTGVCRDRNFDNPVVWVACLARLKAEMVAGGAQRNLRKIRGLNLFDELRKESDGRPSLRMGRMEGVKVGYGFYSPDASGGMASFYKVVDVGPGGKAGLVDRSWLTRRFGEAAVGERLYEYPQSNLYLAPRVSGGFLRGMAGPTTLTTGPYAGQTIAFPSWVAGASVGFAWDFSGTVSSPEWRTMAEVHGLFGATASTKLGLLLIDWPSIEKGFVIGPRLKVFASASLSFGRIWAAVLDPSVSTSAGVGGASVNVQTNAITGSLFGVAAAVGLEYMVHPDLLLRMDVSARTYGSAKLTTTEETKDLLNRNDHYNALLLRLSVERGL